MFKTCNCRHFQCSDGIEWCESVELSSFFCFLSPEIRALERVGSGCFFLSSMAFGYESVELSLFWGSRCSKRVTVVIFNVLRV